VFARARESARKIQCLSNIKNIALAINMYMTDYDSFWPWDHSNAIDSVAQTLWGQSPGNYSQSNIRAITNCNPYLRPAVLLDEYTKNRDIWQCPSAKAETTAGWIVPMGRNGYWVNAYIDNAGSYNSAWGDPANIGPCYLGAFPSGWGGSLTDSFAQGGGSDARVGGETRGATASNPGGFTYSIGIVGATCCPTLEMYRGKKLSQIGDASSAVVVADGSFSITRQPWAAAIAYPDTCGNPSYPCDSKGWGPQLQCFWSAGVDITSQSQFDDFLAGGQTEKSSTRHLGGINIGFVDGHAAWMPSRELVAKFNANELYGAAKPGC
jgi:prepilin-type processing-associated H-X9-DG protein